MRGRPASFSGDSAVMQSHADCEKVQDAYSMRCAPQVHGAAKDAYHFVERVVRTEASAGRTPYRVSIPLAATRRVTWPRN